MKDIVVIDYGAGNVRSVSFALDRLGYKSELSSDENRIRSADYVIFPGVGHAKPAMDILEKKGLTDVIRTLKQPVLGICLGMQLMCNSSEEGSTQCLGIFDTEVKRFNPHLKVPHIGWNDLSSPSSFLENIVGQVYFVHSFYVPINPFTIAKCDYYGDFSAVIGKDNFFGCQFHPEKSGNVGQEILKKFLEIKQ
ncbi:MAG: imidazole glycerol phosphate synthase subunit HisH [Brumimicrobium sp.]|nr:imidazole glycerol phosphate synthase subunit HisH [Brumimicrobium sp.]